ncbi:hypothetical protein DFH09DRAFT_1150244 [Mycena vulgaris]|nr:hypothetical protein DFH09DRAFT_1150244 [Mycena vulgaris]
MNVAQTQSQLNSNYYFNLVSFTLLFYDYFLTLEWEVSRYWGTPFTWPNFLFFANRYGTLLGNIPVVIQYFWSSKSTPRKIEICRRLESYHQYFIIVTQLMVGSMLVLRTYALYERSKRVLTLMISVAVGAVVAGIWSVVTGKTGDTNDNLPLYFGCDYAISQSQGVSLASAWAGVAVFDFFTRRRPNGADLLTVLLRDGLVMFMSNLSNILTFVSYTRGIATTWTNIISSIMISRLMLNLRDPALSHMTGRVSQSTSVTAGNVMFAPYMGATGPGSSPELDTDAAMDIELPHRGPPKSVGPGHPHTWNVV